MKSVTQKLADIFNLSIYEAKIYTATLGFDRANVSQIARASDIPRTAVYPALKSLINKGLIFQAVWGKRKYYKALPPSNLKRIFDWQKTDLSFVIAKLATKTPTVGENLEVSYFPGENGVRRASDLFLENTKSKLWRTFENAAFNQSVLERQHFERYINERVKKGIRARVILAIDAMSPWLEERVEKSKEELHEIIFIPAKKSSFRVIIGINEDSLLILSLEDVIFGAVIKNVQFAETFATIHDLIWTRYKNTDTL